MDFEWDPQKEVANIAKHAVDFETAARVFLDPYLYEFDDLTVRSESRINAVGMVAGRLLRVTFTQRDDVIRIISARGAARSERRRYHEV